MDRLRDEKFAEFYKKYLGVISKDYEFLESERKKYLEQYHNSFFKKGDNTNKLFKTFLKEHLIKRILYGFYNTTWNKCNGYCDFNYVQKIKESGLFLNLNHNYLLDDEFSGTYKGIEYQALDIGFINPSCEYNEYKAYAKGKDYEHIFNGLILNYKFNKCIQSKTIVSTKKSMLQKDTNKKAYLIAIISIFLVLCIPVSMFLVFSNTSILQNVLKDMFSWGNTAVYAIAIMLILSITIFRIDKTTDRQMREQNDFSKAITLEDPKFNKKFNVYSSDEVEARYLVTPLFMEKFYNLKTIFGAKNIRCSFFDDNFMIAIETERDLFEIGNLYKPVKDIKTIERFYDEITAIFDMIDYFKLNEDIYLK